MGKTPKEDPLLWYLVLRPIAMGGRIDAGQKVQLRKSEAENYPPEYLKEIQGEENVAADGGDADSGNQDDGTGSAGDQTATVDHVVTQEDLDKHGHLRRAGIKVGETIQVPAPKE